MGFWDKVKETAQKAADAAKDQVQREDSLLNKGVDGVKKAADKTVAVAKDQVKRDGSGLNSLRARAAQASDNVLGKIDAMDASATRASQTEMAKRYAAKRKAEALSSFDDPPPEAVPEAAPRFPNSMDWTDDEVYRKVAETIYPEFRSLPAGEKKNALCEIARYDKKIVNLMRSLGSAYIDTVRQLAAEDDAAQAALEASGLTDDDDLRVAYKSWLDDSHEDSFYVDDPDPRHEKAVRLLGWLVFSRLGADGTANLAQAFGDAGARDEYRLGKLLAETRPLVEARDAVVNQAFRPRRGSFTSEFLVHKGLNADPQFAWVEDGKPSSENDGGDDGDDGGFSGGSLMEL